MKMQLETTKLNYINVIVTITDGNTSHTYYRTLPMKNLHLLIRNVTTKHPDGKLNIEILK